LSRSADSFASFSEVRATLLRAEREAYDCSEEPLNTAKEETLEAVAVEKIFESEDASFAVIVFERSSRAGQSAHFTAIGPLGDVRPGETLSLHGRFQEHARHGTRFRVSSYTPILPSTEAGIERFLGSGIIPGV